MARMQGKLNTIDPYLFMKRRFELVCIGNNTYASFTDVLPMFYWCEQKPPCLHRCTYPLCPLLVPA